VSALGVMLARWRFQLYCKVRCVCPIHLRLLHASPRRGKFCPKCKRAWAEVERANRKAAMMADRARDAETVGRARRLKDACTSIGRTVNSVKIT